MDKKIYEIISMYEFTVTNGFLLTGIIAQNVYLLSLVAMLYGKQIPEKIIKNLILKNHPLNIRPSCAKDCDMINKGGCVGGASGRGGFPSGHSTVASFLFFLYLQEFIARKGHCSKSALVITFLFLILLPYARVKLACHTIPQVIGGIVLGCLLALIYFQLDVNVFCLNNRYKSDKEKVYNFIS